MIEQTVKKVEFLVQEQVTVQDSTKECALAKKEAAAQMDNQKSLVVQNNTHQVTPVHNVSDKRPDTKPVSDEQDNQPKGTEGRAEGKGVEINVNKQQRTNIKAVDQINKEPTKPAADTKVIQKGGGGGGGGGMMNGAVKGKGSASLSTHIKAEVSKQCVSTADGKAKGGTQVEVIKASVTPVLVKHLSPPVIKLEPLDVKGSGSCDEVQSMDVR